MGRLIASARKGPKGISLKISPLWRQSARLEGMAPIGHMPRAVLAQARVRELSRLPLPELAKLLVELQKNLPKKFLGSFLEANRAERMLRQKRAKKGPFINLIIKMENIMRRCYGSARLRLFGSARMTLVL